MIGWIDFWFLCVCAVGLFISVWVLDDRLRETARARANYRARVRAVASAMGGDRVRRVSVSFVGHSSRPYRVEVDGRVWGFSCSDDFVRFLDLAGDAVTDSGVLVAVSVCGGVSMLHPSFG